MSFMKIIKLTTWNDEQNRKTYQTAPQKFSDRTREMFERLQKNS